MRVTVACSGLGHIRRGFEASAEECFDTLRDSDWLDLTLYRSAGASSPAEVNVRSLQEEKPLTRTLARLLHRQPAMLESTSFAFSLVHHVWRQRPHVVYFSPWHIGRVLAVWRRLSGQDFRLLLSNGGPGLPPFTHLDHVQQVSPVFLDQALEAGEPPEKHTLLPHGLDIPETPLVLSADDRGAARERLGVAPTARVVLSVGALNCSHKRQDYVIREIARLPKPRPFLILLGQVDGETPTVRRLASQLLEPGSYLMRTVSAAEVPSYYRVADVSVLASVREAFGRVLAEALSHGLPCLAHDYAVPRFVMGRHGDYANLTKDGSLAGALRQRLAEETPASAREERRRHVYENFSWNRLRPAYERMFDTVARRPALRLPWHDLLARPRERRRPVRLD